MNIKQLFVASILVFGSTNSSMATVIANWDFNDGTLQGWTIELPFNGSFFNENGYLVGTDSIPRGGGLLVRAPGISGDLSNLLEINYDQFVYNNGGAEGTAVYIKGTDGTFYRTSYHSASINKWSTRTVRLDREDEWRLVPSSGSSSYIDVLNSADGIFIDMDASSSSSVRESAIDNVSLNAVPIPTAFLLLGSGLIGLIGIRNGSSKVSALSA